MIHVYTTEKLSLRFYLSDNMISKTANSKKDPYSVPINSVRFFELNKPLTSYGGVKFHHHSNSIILTQLHSVT